MLVFLAYEHGQPEEIHAVEAKNEGINDLHDEDESDDEKDEKKGLSNKKKKVSSSLHQTTYLYNI